MAFDTTKQLERAKRYLERNKIEDAIEAYQVVLNENPGNVESLQALGDIYTRLGQPDRAGVFYAPVFDRLFEMREEAKALALYTRALKGAQQPPERMSRYALLLQKQHRAEEAIEQLTLASELFLARGREDPALDCLERVAQLDPDNAIRQCAVGELAERAGKPGVAARAFLRAGQLFSASKTAGDAETALELLERAHRIAPHERSPALLYAQAQLRRGDAAAAVKTLEPFASGEIDSATLATLGEALMEAGALGRAQGILERLPPEQAATSIKLFDLARRYLSAGDDAAAVALLGRMQKDMVEARRESEFAAQLDALVEAHRGSMMLVEFWAAVYAALNREVKYFDALVRLFDMYLEAGNVAGAGEALEKLVDIDAYDSRHQQRLDRLKGRADTAFLARMRTRLSQLATNSSEKSEEPTANRTAQAPAAGARDPKEQTLEDLIVQAEIFMQYSLQAKVVERLEEIAELFPKEEERNERLRNLYRMANWRPPGSDASEAGVSREMRGTGGARNNAVAKASKGAVKSEFDNLKDSPGQAGGNAAVESVDTMRDLARISELSQSLFRMTSPRAILSASANEMGSYLGAARCLAVIGSSDSAPEMVSEFCAPGIESAPRGLLTRLLAQLDNAAPDPMGGLSLDASAVPLLREMGLQTVLGVALSDPETRSRAGMVIAGHAEPYVWRMGETYFLQTIGDQMLLSISHTRLRAKARTSGTADEKTGLLARSAYQDCLVRETQRAKGQGVPLSLVLVQFDRGSELLRKHGEAQVEGLLEQLARVLIAAIRQTDIAVKYTSWGIAVVLPDTPLAGAHVLAEKLRKAGAQLQPQWGGAHLTISASIVEAVGRVDYDSEDIVTELINRAEAGLEQTIERGGDAVVTPAIAGF